MSVDKSASVADRFGMAHDDEPRSIIPQKPPPPPPPGRERRPEPIDPGDPGPHVPDPPPSRPSVPPSQRPTAPRVEQPSGQRPRHGHQRRSFPPPPPDVEIIDRAARVTRDSEPLMLIGLGGDRRRVSAAGSAPDPASSYRPR